ncbi:hypothetical protein ACM66B_006425 [Microbotryomycetes sp. NB124-2]
MSSSARHTPLFGGSQPWPKFVAVNDTVRGGNSSSSWTTDERNTAKFEGELDITALGGAGFASQCATFDKPIKIEQGALGLELKLVNKVHRSGEKHEPHTFTLVLKNERAQHRPDGRRESVLSYEFSFTRSDSSNGQAVFASWTDFKATYRGRPQKGVPLLDPHSVIE